MDDQSGNHMGNVAEKCFTLRKAESMEVSEWCAALEGKINMPLNCFYVLVMIFENYSYYSSSLVPWGLEHWMGWKCTIRC